MKADATGRLGRFDERHIPSTRPRPRGAEAAAPAPVSFVVSVGPEAMWLAVHLVPKHPTARAVHHMRILQLQRTVGNRQVERLLWPSPGPEVKRGDAAACACPAEKQDAHAGLRHLASPHSGAVPPVQRDWWEEDAEGEAWPEESGPSVPDRVGEQTGSAMEWASQNPSEAEARAGTQGGAAVDWAVEQVGA